MFLRDRREQERELEKQKEREREREREIKTERDKQERDRIERERLEKQRAEQAVHKHFEESLRLAQAKVRACMTLSQVSYKPVLLSLPLPSLPPGGLTDNDTLVTRQ